MSPDQKLIELIAADLGVDPSFVEKDWHAMRLVAVVAGIAHETIRPVFSGGTSLSKGYGLIKRFSEDLDFKLMLPAGGVNRSGRRSYRKLVIETIRGAGNWKIDDDDIHPASRFFSCRISYRNIFTPTPALRSQVKLDMFFAEPALPTEDRPLRSFVAEARKEDAEVAAIACVSPVETAADKLSALTWRVLTRQRDSADDDPTPIRHLHDLVALEDLATEYPAFPELFNRIMLQDAERWRPSPEIVNMTPAERLTAALEILTGEPEYPREYEKFVLDMSYADEGQRPGFDEGLAAGHRLRDRLP